MVKDAAVSTRRRFYEVKDIFLNRYSHCLIEGWIVREETKTCRACGGSGWSELYQDECERCDDGIYQRRILYIHNLNIEGRRYSFHSYERPKVISNIPGETKDSYGGKFTEAELKELQLPCSGLVRMLRWVAFNRWPMGAHELKMKSQEVISQSLVSDHKSRCQITGVRQYPLVDIQPQRVASQGLGNKPLAGKAP